MGRKPTDIANFTLRLREDLRRKLEKEATRKDHSLNSEIVERLEQSFLQQELLKAVPLAIESTIKSVMGTIYKPPEQDDDK